jgi:hypothetical protein
MKNPKITIDKLANIIVVRLPKRSANRAEIGIAKPKNNTEIKGQVVHFVNLSDKLQKENKLLKEKLYLLENDPESYKIRMEVDPYNEENWD